MGIGDHWNNFTSAVSTGARRTRDAVVDTTRAARDGAGRVRDNAVEGARTLRDNAVDGARTLRDNAVDGARTLRDNAVDGARTLRDNAVDGARTLRDNAVDGARTLRDNAVDGARTLRDNAVDTFDRHVLQPTRDAMEQALNTVRRPIENAFLEQINHLNEPGESFTVAGGANVSAYAITGAGSREISIAYSEDADGKPVYTVRAGGELGVGLDVGQKLGVEGSDAEIMASAGVYMEYTFSTPEEAARAAAIFSTQALVGNNVPLGAALHCAEYLAGDKQFLNEHLSAIELGPKIAGELGISGIASLGIEGSISASARIEFEEGRPSALVFGQELSVAGNASLGLNFADGVLDDELSLSLLNGEARVTLSAEQRIPLDASQLSNLFTDPVGSLRGALNTSEATASLKASFDYSLQAASPVGTSGKLELEFSGKPSEILNREVAEGLAQGNFRQVAGYLGDNLQVSLTASQYVNTGFDINPEIKVRGFGGGIEAKAQRTEIISSYSQEGSIRELLFGS